MTLLEKMGCLVANTLVINGNGALSAADDTILILVGFVVFLEGLHEEISSFLSSFGLLLSVSLIFFGLVGGCVRCCLGDTIILGSHTIILCCCVLLLAPSALFPALILLL